MIGVQFRATYRVRLNAFFELRDRFQSYPPDVYNMMLLRLLSIALAVLAASAEAAPRVPTLAPPQSTVDQPTGDTTAPLFQTAEPVEQSTEADLIIAPPLLKPINSEAMEASDTMPTPAQLLEPTESAAGIGVSPVWNLPPAHHAWARFQLGAWRTLRIRSESFDERGITLGQSTTIRTETLTHVASDHYQLQINTIVEVGGKQLPGTVQEVVLNLVTDSQAQTTVPQKKGTTMISLHGQAIPCTIWSLVTPTDQGEREELIYYTPGRAPYILKRERTDRVEEKTIAQKTTRVVREGLPAMVGRSFQPSYHLSITEHLLRGGQRERFEAHCDNVPGGLIYASETDYGLAGERLRWTTIELVQSSFDSVAPGPGGVRVEFSPGPSRKSEAQPKQKKKNGDKQQAPKQEEPKEEEPKPRRLLRLLRRAELFFPAEESETKSTEPVSSEAVAADEDVSDKG